MSPCNSLILSASCSPCLINEPCLADCIHIHVSKYTALLQIHTPEYFTSLVAGIARGAPAFLTGGNLVSISRSVVRAGSVSGFRGRGPVFWVNGGFSFTHAGNENHLGWVVWSKETITGVIPCCLANWFWKLPQRRVYYAWLGFLIKNPI